MRYTMTIVAVLTLGTASCAGTDEMGDGSLHETGAVQEALLGATTEDVSCTNQGRADELENLAFYGRVLSRSNAFNQCVRRVMDQATVLPLASGNTYGPYIACGTGSVTTNGGHICSTECPNKPVGSDCLCDAVGTASLPAQRARILSAAASRRPINQFCAPNLPAGTIHGGAISGGIQSGAEKWTWNSLGDGAGVDVVWSAGVAWHEAMHDHGYWHGDRPNDPPAEQPDNCGFGFNQTAAYTAYNAATAAVGACMIEVGRRSESAAYGNCDLESALCAANERRVIRTFDSGSGDCVCVPDAFNWPTNENEANDEFGTALAVGDFDNDGFDDLAIGAPGEDSSSGALYVYRGTSTGLQPWKRVTQANLTVDDAALGVASPGHETGDRFGEALAAGDFNNDGFDDLAIGSPGEKLSDATCSAGGCGYVALLPGTTTGLKFIANQTSPNPTGLTQAVVGANESGDHFGASLAAGDLNGDLRDDLAVGAPQEGLGAVTVVGAVMLFTGQASQSRLVNPWTNLAQTLSGISLNESGDEFGAAVTIGNVYSSDGREELVIGSPGERWDNEDDEGFVYVADYNGTSWSMPQAFGNPFDSGASRFGAALATGDVRGDSVADLVVGAPEETGGAGGVTVHTGAASTISYVQHLHNGDSVAGDNFGQSVAVSAFRPGSKQAITVGIPGEIVNSIAQGAIWVYEGSTSNISAVVPKAQSDVYGVSATDTVLPTEKLDLGFGFAVAGGNFNGVAGSEVAVGGPFDDPAQDGTLTGAVFVFRYNTIADAQKIDQVTTRYGDDHF